MLLDFVITALVTLFVTVDPIGLAPVFIALTLELEAGERRAVAWRAGLIAFCALAFFSLAGVALLRTLGIELAALRIAGGILLFSIGFEMVFERRIGRKRRAAGAGRSFNMLAAPLAIPLMAGPGAITAVTLLSTRAGADSIALALLLLIIALVVACCVVVFLASELVMRAIGETGSAILSRLLGLILTALAVQFVVDGWRAL